jgi:hypothetical protein
MTNARFAIRQPHPQRQHQREFDMKATLTNRTSLANRSSLALLLALGIFGTFSTSALAQSGAATNVSPVEAQPVTVNGITYLCGGVGDSSAAQMKTKARDYNLILTFATRDGHFLADVSVKIMPITTKVGQAILDIQCDAPMLLVNLPRGASYHVVAATGGITEQQTVRLAANGAQKRASLLWPTNAFIGANEPLNQSVEKSR